MRNIKHKVSSDIYYLFDEKDTRILASIMTVSGISLVHIYEPSEEDAQFFDFECAKEWAQSRVIHN